MRSHLPTSCSFIHSLRRARDFMRKFAILIALITSQPVAAASVIGVIFQDDFESGDLSKTQNGFTWLSGTRTSVNTANPRNGSSSMEFSYQAAADQADSSAEQRFTLGEYYKELFIKFDIFIPLNYVHRPQSGSATNNKWFVDVWQDSYGNNAGIAFDVNLWSITGASFFVSAPRSTDPKYNAGGRHIGGSEWIDQAVIKPTDIGKWLEVIEHFKYATGPTSNDGIIELYIKPAGGISRKHISKTNGDWYVAETATQGRGMNNGYLMGWANSGYSQQTNFYIDNIIFSTAQIVSTPSIPTLSINDFTTDEGNSGGTNATFTVALSAASSQTVTANYATADNTATLADSDYAQRTSTLLTFAPGGSLTQTVTVLVNGDTKVEANETFFVNLSSPVNATITDNQGVGTIVNDDAVPELAISDAVVNEGNSGTVNALFTVTLSAASGQTIAVNYATFDGTATLADNDYLQRSSALLTFAPGGPLTQTITIPVNGDTKNETNETFLVNLSSPTNATLADGLGVGTISNDDGTVIIDAQQDCGSGSGLGLLVLVLGFLSGLPLFRFPRIRERH